MIQFTAKTQRAQSFKSLCSQAETYEQITRIGLGDKKLFSFIISGFSLRTSRLCG